MLMAGATSGSDPDVAPEGMTANRGIRAWPRCASVRPGHGRGRVRTGAVQSLSTGRVGHRGRRDRGRRRAHGRERSVRTRHEPARRRALPRPRAPRRRRDGGDAGGDRPAGQRGLDGGSAVSSAG